MNARELRIGNWVRLKHHDFTYQIEYHELHSERMDDIEPIPLTPEWLERFGFENSINLKKSDSFFFVYVGGSELHINPSNGVVWIERGNNIFNNPLLIEYVHQLQNLYFALTGEELTVKEPVEK